jgi:integrase
VFAAYREAKKVEAQLLEQLDRGEQRGSSTRTVGELVGRWLEWRQQVRPISPVTVANYRGAIDRYITPNLGRAKVHEVDAATLDTLYARVRATGGKCRDCWKRIRRGEPALGAGVRYRPRPGAEEAVHEPDCTRPRRDSPAAAAAMEQDPELGLFLRLAVVLGARRSGLIALKWRQVDLGASEAHHRRAAG